MLKVVSILIFVGVAVSKKDCFEERTCFDEKDVAHVMNNPFLKKSLDDDLSRKANEDSQSSSHAQDASESAIGSKRTGSVKGQAECPSIDICQVMCLKNMLGSPGQAPGRPGPSGKRGPSGSPGQPGIQGPPGPQGPPGYPAYPMGYLPPINGQQIPSTQNSIPRIDINDSVDPLPCKMPDIIVGLKGEKGAMGLALKGDAGAPGSDGSPGIPGESGPRGFPGDAAYFQGPMKGETGLPGRDGATGEKGGAGQPGESGLRGDKGERGDGGAFIIFMPSSQSNMTEAQKDIFSGYGNLQIITDQMRGRVRENRSSTVKMHKSCAALRTASPRLGNGHFLIDPNGGDPEDGIRVFCDMETMETCIQPRSNRSQNITSIRQEIAHNEYCTCSWLSLIEDTEIDYGASNSQIAHLQLTHNYAKQSVIIHCLNFIAYVQEDVISSHEFDKAILLTGWNDARISAAGVPSRLTYTADLDECRNLNDSWGRTILSYNSDKSVRLPIVDVGIRDYGSDKLFSVEIGPVCFRDSIPNGRERGWLSVP